MIINGSLDGPGTAPARWPQSHLIASVDVEWSKNYKIKNGNLAFCYSIIWFTCPTGGDLFDSRTASWDYSSAYIDADTERRDLVELIASDLGAALEHADLIVGHQLCSDLAVISANANGNVPPAVTRAQTAWRARRTSQQVQMFDTRFDAGHLLTGKSRRLVDVCAEVDLSVTQPELARKSMTALHRDWLTAADTEARERITVLNLRHSLSTALVAARASDLGTWQPALNINHMLAHRLDGAFGWLAHPTFQQLI